LDNGADPKKQDQIGRWPLHVAAFYTTDTKIIDILLQKKEIIDVNDCDKFGVTALHNAAMASNSKMARHLLAKGANINCRDRNGLTPLHVAVTFAKDMEMIDLFLNNKKVNLHYCDKLGQNVIAYAQKNTYGLREKIIGCLKEIDDGVIKEYNLLKLAKFEMHTPIWKSLINNLNGYFSNDTFTFQTSHPSELFYVPYADLKPGKGSEISKSVLIWYIANKASRKQRNFAESEMPGSMKLLSDIDHDSQITEIQIYNGRKSNSVKHLTRAFSFVFKTTSKKDGEHWWSLERNVNYVVLQRSRDTDAVKNKCGGKNRKEVEPDVKILIENGSIKNIFHQNPMLDLKHFLTNMYKWHPLFLAIYFGNARLFERTKEMAKLDKEFTLLNSERTFSNRKEIVFQEKQKADPTTRDVSGRNALANAEVLDLLLKHENVKMDGFERSALHFAAISPHVDVAKHLIKTGEKPNSLDSNGLTPLHLAAYHSDDTEMIDLLLEAQKKSQGDERIDNLNKHDGITALHSAAIASNEITAKHLIEKGADPNRKDKFGRTPLHLAAFFAKNTKIIDVFLNNKQVDVNSLDYSGQDALYYAQRNQYGQTRKILNRMKGIGSMNRGNNTTALNLAIQYSTEMVKFLCISVLPYSLVF
jgi:ankyrin repeat protein